VRRYITPDHRAWAPHFACPLTPPSRGLEPHLNLNDSITHSNVGKCPPTPSLFSGGFSGHGDQITGSGSGVGPIQHIPILIWISYHITQKGNVVFDPPVKTPPPPHTPLRPPRPHFPSSPPFSLPPPWARESLINLRKFSFVLFVKVYALPPAAATGGGLGIADLGDQQYVEWFHSSEE